MHNLFKISVFLLLFIHSIPIISAEEENLKFINWINETKNYLVNFKSVSSNFTQIDNIGNISKGTFWSENGNYFGTCLVNGPQKQKSRH